MELCSAVISVMASGAGLVDGAWHPVDARKSPAFWVGLGR